MKIKEIRLSNYKGRGTWDFSAKFGQRTKISGKNGSGKSSIMDAYLETLTGKLADGSSPDAIRPHDQTGKDVNRADIIREITFEMEDGAETTVSKITSQKWRKPRGKSEEIFDGNQTRYEIDGFSSSNQKDFLEWQNKIANPDALLMCSNARPFLNLMQKSTAEARKLLESLAGFSVERFVAENPQFEQIAKMLKGHSPEDVLKKLRKDVNTQRKECEKIRGNIEYEQTRAIGGIEVSDLELAVNALNEQIAELDRQESELDASITAYDKASSEIIELKFEQSEIEKAANEGIVENHAIACDALTILNVQKRALENGLSAAQMELKRAEMSIRSAEADLKRAQEDYPKYMEMQFDESETRKIQAEEITQESFICPTCHQMLTPEQQEQARESFEKSKQERIDEQQRLKAQFEERKKRKLDETVELGNISSERLKTAKAARERMLTEIETIKEELAENAAKIAEQKKAIEELPKEADLSGNDDYQRITGEIARQEEALKAMNNGAEARKEIRAKRKELSEKLTERKAEIIHQNAAQDEKERKVEELESQLKSAAQRQADIERQIDTLLNFSIEKNRALAAKVNPHFLHFQFAFTDMTQDGNVYETLRMIRGGTDYFSGLNYSDRALCELDLVCGLQELNNLSLPVWLDNAESIDSSRWPNTEQQLIILERTDEPTITISMIN